MNPTPKNKIKVKIIIFYYRSFYMKLSSRRAPEGVPLDFSSISPSPSTKNDALEIKISFVFFFSRGWVVANTWWDTRPCYCYQFSPEDGEHLGEKQKQHVPRVCVCVCGTWGDETSRTHPNINTHKMCKKYKSGLVFSVHRWFWFFGPRVQNLWPSQRRWSIFFFKY